MQSNWCGQGLLFRVIPDLFLSSYLYQNSLPERSICFIFYLCFSGCYKNLASEIKTSTGGIRTEQQLFLPMKKDIVSGVVPNLICPCARKKKEKECASNYLKCKINKSQTCVTFSPIIINKGRIWRERLEPKHSPLLLADQIKLSLERLPGSRTLMGKNKDHSRFRVPCNIQLRFHRRLAY